MTTGNIDELVGHMSMISDAMLVRDMTPRSTGVAELDQPVFVCVADPSIRELVEQYYRLRRFAPSFNARSWEGGCPGRCDGEPHFRSCVVRSHREVAAEWPAIMKARRTAERERARCPVCGRPGAGRRETCGLARCRQTLWRQRKEAQKPGNLGDKPQVRA